MVYVQFIHKLALLFALTYLCSLLWRRWRRDTMPGQALHGIVFGGIAIAVMMDPWRFVPGLVFDSRSVVISVAGLFGGPVTAAVAAVMATGYRVYLGGAGVVAGVGVVLTSAVLGSAYHRVRRPQIASTNLIHLYLFGIVVHLAMLVCMFALPGNTKWEVLGDVAVPVMVVFPLGVVLVAKLLADQELRLRAERALRRERDLFKRTTETSPLGIMLVGLKGEIQFANPRAAEFLGLDPLELVSRDYTDSAWDITDYEGNPLPERELPLQQVMRAGEPVHDLPQTIERADGSRVLLSVNAAPLRDESDRLEGVVVGLKDVTDLAEANGELMRVNRALKTLSTCNEALVRAESESELLDAICRNITGIGGYRCAWVGLAEDDDTKTVRPVAQDGFEHGYLDAAGITWADTERGHGPTGTAVRTGEPVVCQDLLADPHYAPWREHARQRGCGSAIALPLTGDRRVMGALSIYAAEPNVFGAEEEALLTELAADLAYGITTLRARDEQERTLEALEVSEARFRALVEQIPAVIYTAALDEASTTLYVSPQIETFIGYTSEEYTADPDIWRKRLHPEDRARVLAEVQRAHESGEPFASEYRMIARDGRVVWFRDEAAVVRDAKGDPLQLQGLMFDITDRQQAHEALRESQEKTRRILDNIGVGVALISPQMEVIELNRQMREWFPACDPDDRPVCYGAFNDPPNEGPCDYCPCVLTLRDGEVHEAVTQTPQQGRIIHYRIVSAPVTDAGGRVTGVIEMVEDVTERMELEQQLRQSQKLEGIGQLAGGVAHDFNNLLTGISGYTQFVLEGAKEGTRMHEDLAEVRALTDRAANLTRQLLAFSRRQALEPVVLNINDIIEELSKMLKRLIGEHIRLEFMPAAGLGNVCADPGQIEQIVVNLVVNARDAMPDGGKLTVETDNIELDQAYADEHVGVKPGAYVMLAITDTGHGMDGATQQRIFEPFFTTKEVGKGTGLGLATVYGIVKQHGGNIWVYSEPGQGTTFKVYLPRVSDEVEDPTAQIEVAPLPQGTETILIVEDEESVRQVAERALTAQGYRVLSAGSPSEADRLVEACQDEIGFLLTDVVMPECSGKVVYERLKTRCPSLKVLFMSGYTDNAIVHHGILDTGTPFIQKPFGPERLLRKVQEVLNC